MTSSSPIRVSDGDLDRVVRVPGGDVPADPVVTAVADHIARRNELDPDALRAAGGLFCRAAGRTEDPIELSTAMAVLAASERDPNPDWSTELRALVDDEALTLLVVDALVGHRPGDRGRRSTAEARAVEELLCKLIYMFHAQSAARALEVQVS